MEFKILGPLEVYADDGSRIQVPGGRERALIVALLLRRGQVVSVDALIEALWGEHPPSTAAKAVQGYVSHVRRLLGTGAGDAGGVLATQAPGYVLRVQDSHVDAARFERRASEGQQALEDGSPDEALAALDGALALWRGPALTDFAYADFAQREIHRLEERRLEAVEDRADALLALGRHSGLVAELDALVDAHPLRARLRGQLMLALHRSGRQADALQVYRDGVRHLRELGLEPSPELQQLERAILDQGAAVAFETSDHVARSPAKAGLPAGTVTLLWSDVEGSTVGLRSVGTEAWATVLARHLELMRSALEKHHGVEVDTQGDAFFAAFSRASDAIAAAVEAQRSHAAEVWPGLTSIRVRIGLHSGTPAAGEGGYVGLDVHRVARVGAVAHGGEILCSGTTAALVEGDEPEGVRIVELGSYQLKDFPRRERLSRVVAEGLPHRFPPPAAPPAASTRRRVLLIAAVAAGVALLAGAGAFALASSLRSTPAVTVLIPGVAVIDPETNRVVESVRVGSKPATIAASDDAVWVGDARDGTVTRLDPSTRETRAIGIGAPAVDIATRGDDVWVATGAFGTVVRIDGGLSAVADRIELGAPESIEVPSAVSIAAGEEGIWVGARAGIARIDPRTTAVVDQVDLGGAPALQIAVGGGAVWATTFASRAWRVEASSGQKTADFYAGSSVYPIAVDETGVWVGSFSGQLWRLDSITGATSLSVNLGSPVLAIALGKDAIWVTTSGEHALVRVDRATGAREATIPLDGLASEVVVAHERVWVAIEEPEPES